MVAAGLENRHAQVSGVVHLLCCAWLWAMQAHFEGNHGSIGGALVLSGGGRAVLQGPTTFVHNVGSTGGALVLFTGSAMSISGTLCAHDNYASSVDPAIPGAIPGPAGFAFVYGFQFNYGTNLNFLEPGKASLANNALNDIVVAAGGIVTTPGSGPWPTPQTYNITGTVGSCADAFAAGNATTCNSCGAETPWDAGLCACKVRHLFTSGNLCELSVTHCTCSTVQYS